jgi:hypothetical protein
MIENYLSNQIEYFDEKSILLLILIETIPMMDLYEIVGFTLRLLVTTAGYQTPSNNNIIIIITRITSYFVLFLCCIFYQSSM